MKYPKRKEIGESKRFLQDNSPAPFVVCGQVFHPVLPLQLDKDEPPVKLAQLTINTEGISKPCILITFSAFVTSILRKERFNDLVFRLVRTCGDHLTREILQEWPFRRVFANDINAKEPVVYDFCEWLSKHHSRICTYTFELAAVNISEQSSYDITQKSMTAQVYKTSMRNF
jgi:hypothetical protein